jgi:alpha-tubulin suppressor-like RCC1 family protein
MSRSTRTHSLRIPGLTAVGALLLGLLVVTPQAAEATPIAATDTLRSGAAWGVGRNDFGQVNPAQTSSPSTAFAALPASGGGAVSDAVSIAAGNGWVVWADHNGKVWSLGDNTNGKRGNGTVGGVDRVPVQANGFGGASQPKAVKVTAFGNALNVLDADGGVWQWGQVVNSSTTLAIQSTPNKLSFGTASPQPRILDVSAGESFSIAVDASNKVWTWGKNDRGQLGLGTNNASPYPTQVPTAKLPLAPQSSKVWVEAGRDFAVYVESKSGGGLTIYTWGRGDLFQLGLGASKTTDQKSPMLVTVPSPGTTGETVQSLSAGTSHTLLLTSKPNTNAMLHPVMTLRWWGSQTLSGGTQSANVPAVVADPVIDLPVNVAAGDSASFVPLENGTVAVWGKGASAQLGKGSTADIPTPQLLSVPGALPVRKSGVPVQITSRSGETYALVNADITTSPDLNGLVYDFGRVAANLGAAGYADHLFSFTNVATKQLDGLAPVVRTTNEPAGPLSTEFKVVAGGTCGSSLAVNGSCTVKVRYTPSTTAGSTGFLFFATSNTNPYQSPMRSVVPLQGTGYQSYQGIGGYSVSLPDATVAGPGAVIDLRNLSPDLIPDSYPVGTQSLASQKLPLVELASQKLASQKLASQKLASQKLASQKLASQKLSLGTVAVAELASQKLASQKLASQKLPFLDISLQQLPLLYGQGWQTLLAAYPNLANVPVSALKLADLLDPALNLPSDPNVALPLERVALGDLDIRNSVLADVSVLALLQGKMNMDQYPASLCPELAALATDTNCATGAGTHRSMFELSLVYGTDLAITSLGHVTVGELTTDAESASTNPLDDTLWGRITLASTTLGGTHVGDIGLSTVPDMSRIADCSKTSCTATAGRHLGDPDVVAALLPDAMFKDLGSALNDIQLAWMVEPFLDRASFDWEKLPRSSLPLAAYPNQLPVSANVSVNCDNAAGLTFGFVLPQGFRYIPGTATLSTSPTTNISLSDPVDSPTDSPNRGLVLSVPGLNRSSSSPLACVNDGFSVVVGLKVLPSEGQSSGNHVSGDVRTSTLGPLTGTSPGAGVQVTGINQPPGDTPDGPVGREDTLVLGHLNPGQQAQYLPIDVAPGRIIEATLTGLSANPDPKTDLDLTLYYPVGATAEQALSGTGAPMQVSFGEVPRQQTGRGRAGTASGGSVQDIPVLRDRLVAAMSATRNADDEQLSAIARQGTSTRHVLAVTSFDGAWGDYTLRVRLVDPSTLNTCNTTPLAIGTPAAATLYKHQGDPAGFGGNDDTVVLVNASRQQAYYGNSSGVLEEAYTFTHSANGVRGQVLQVDSDPQVQVAYSDWDAHPCDPAYSNKVVRAINDLVLRTVDIKKIKYVNVVGTHPVIPYAWLEDHTRDGSEREEAGELVFDKSNPLALGMARGYFPSDDPYGTFQPIAVHGQVIYLPQAVTGRLGETSAQVIAQLRQFTTAGPASGPGIADPRASSTQPRTAVATDYDFLSPAGDLTASGLQAAGYTTDHTLTGATASWTAAQLRARWTGATPVPDVAALNMHYDQYRALPAAAAAGSSSDLYTADLDVRNAPSLARHVILTEGCHSALNIPDGYVTNGDVRGYDFAQAYAQQNAALMIGNLGFGFADNNVVAYSARLQTLITDKMDELPIGSALVAAKRRYVTTLGGLSPYDLKSVQEMVLWGIPQYRLPGVAAPGQFAAAALSGPSSATTDPMTGLPSTGFSVGTSANELSFVSGDGSAVYANGSLTPKPDDGTPRVIRAKATDPSVPDHSPQSIADAGNPVLSAQFTELPSTTDSQGNPLVVKSVVPRALVSLPVFNATNAFSEPGFNETVDLQDALTGAFPATLGHTWTVPTGDGYLTSFVMTPQRVLLDGTAPGHGKVQLFPSSEWVALLGTPGVGCQDLISRVDATQNALVTRFTVDVLPCPGSTTRSVYVLAPPTSGSGAWVKGTLFADPANPTRYTGEVAGSHTGSMVVSTNSFAESSISFGKSFGWDSAGGPSGDEFNNLVIGDPDPSGWYTTKPTATSTNGYGVYVDGVRVTTPYLFGNGDFLVRLQRPDGTWVTGHREIRVDDVVPTVAMTIDGQPAGNLPSYPDDGNLHHLTWRSNHGVTVTVTSGPSGATYTTQGTAPDGQGGLKVDTSTLGAPAGGQQLSATATSGAGLVGSATWLFRTVYGSAGFVAPVAASNGGVIRSVKYEYSFAMQDGLGQEVKTATTGAFTSSWAGASGCSGGSLALPTLSSDSTPRYGATGALLGGSGPANAWRWDLAAPTSGCQRLTVRLNDGYTPITTLVQVVL